MRCLLYARVSTDSQKDHNVSLSDQIKAMRRFVHDKGWTIYSEVQESASGFTGDRPFLETIMELAKKREFDAFIVLRTDRFARDEGVFIVLERFFFRDCGIRLFSVEEGEFTPGVVNKFLAAIQRAKAEDDAELIKKRLKAGRHAYLKSNVPQSQGYALYGYKKEGKKKDTRYLINEKEAQVVRLIYDLFTDDRFTYYAIAMHLNDASIPSPVMARRNDTSGHHGKWHDITVRSILKNPAYKGNLKGMKTRWENKKEVKNDLDVQTNITIPAIISVKQWDSAQYLLAHKPGAKKSVRKYQLSGMLTCICGHNMYGCSISTFRKRKQQKVYSYFYRCNSYNKMMNRTGCTNKHIIADKLESTVWDFVDKLITNPKTTLALYQKDQSAKEALMSNVQERIAAIDDIISENTAELRRLQRMFQKGGCDEDYFDAEKGRLDRERQALDREYDKAKRLLDQNKNAIAQLSELEEIGEEVRGSLLGISDDRKRRIYERLRLHVTAEKPQGSDQYIIIEVLGYKERIRIKNSSAC